VANFVSRQRSWVARCSAGSSSWPWDDRRAARQLRVLRRDGGILSITQLPEAKPEPGSVLARLAEGLAQVRSDAVLSRLIVMQCVGLVFFTVTIPVEVVYTQHTLHAGAAVTAC